MSELPQRLSGGTALSAHWLNRLLDFLRSRELRAGPGVRLTRTPSGTTISVPGPGGTEEKWPETVPGIVGARNGSIPYAYDVTIYPEGLGSSTQKRVSFFLTDLPVSAAGALTPGMVVLVHPVPACVVDASENDQPMET